MTPAVQQAVPSWLARYGAAVLLTAFALALRWLLDPWMGEQMPLAMVYAAVVLAAWWAGTGPAALAAVLGALAGDFFFVQPRHALDISALSNTSLLAYFAVCGLLIVVGTRTRALAGASERGRRELEDSERQRQLIVDALPMLISYVDREHRYRFTNRAYSRWFERDHLTLRGRHVREVIGEAAYDRVLPYLERALSGEEVAYETTVPYSGAGTRHISATYVPHRIDGEVAGVYAMVEDVTARRSAEHARGLLAAIVESSEDAIVSKTVDGLVTSWNEGAQRLFGYAAEEMLGQPGLRIVPPHLVDEERGVLERIARGERLQPFETERLHRDGRRIAVSLTISPMRDDSGAIVGASNIVRDVGERRQMEQQLRSTLEHLSDADRRKDEFLATLAHELRNPLAPILNAAQYMRLTTQFDPELQRASEMVERQAKHMRRLVDDLLDVSRMTRGRIRLQKEPMALSSAIEAAVEACRPQIDMADHELVVRMPDEAVMVDGDLTRLSQVVANLLANAAKYTPRGGRIEVSLAREGAEAVVRVADNGVGMAPELLGRVFDMFTQAEAALEHSQGGLGIGLTLARQLVELHGGRIEARSEGPGRGSELVVRLPLQGVPLQSESASVEPVHTPARPLEASSQSAQPRLTLLVADDNHDAAESVTMMLQLEGHEVHVVHDARSAIEAVMRLQPDVALLDIGMPEMDGYEAARRIRARPGGGDIVLVALTGWGQASDRQRALDAGFDQHFTKPIDFSSLQHLLAEVPPTTTPRGKAEAGASSPADLLAAGSAGPARSA